MSQITKTTAIDFQARLPFRINAPFSRLEEVL